MFDGGSYDYFLKKFVSEIKVMGLIARISQGCVVEVYLDPGIYIVDDCFFKIAACVERVFAKSYNCFGMSTVRRVLSPSKARSTVSVTV